MQFVVQGRVDARTGTSDGGNVWADVRKMETNAFQKEMLSIQDNERVSY